MYRFFLHKGDFKSGDQILEWILLQKNPGSEIIEEVDGDALKKLIKAAQYLAVLFYAEGPECDGCKGILDELENIDDDTDRHGIQFVKTTDIGMAQDYGVKDFPALVYFEKQIPNVYDGKPKSRKRFHARPPCLVRDLPCDLTSLQAI